MEEGIIVQIAVCDDEKMMRQRLCESIRAYDDSICIREFCSGDELLQTKEQFQVIFLDIDMPGRNGLETAKALREQRCTSELIFLTSYTECAPDAFVVRAWRYLVKPLDEKKLYEALDGIRDVLTENKVFAVIRKGKTTKIELSRMMYLEAYGDGTYLYDCDGSVYESTESLKAWEEKLVTEDFYRIHKSYLVAMAYVRKVEGDLLSLGEHNTELKISRRNVGSFKRAYLAYLDKKAR